MKFQDWHTHNSMCHHAVGSLEDYVKKAAELNLDILGISDHFPYNYLSDINGIPIEEYAMVLDEIKLYFIEIDRLKKKYNKKIQIKIGFEVDFIEGQINNLNYYFDKYKLNLDYILGSIHLLNSEKGLWGMDDSRFLEHYNSVGTDNVYKQYYQLMQKMIKNKDFDFDIITHFDLPKKFNRIPISKDLIMEEVHKTLDCVEKRNLVIEINTAGFRKEIGEQYPSKEIITIMYDKRIPILLGSDAHNPNELSYKFKEVIKLLKSIGYNQLASFSKRERNFIKI